MNNEISTAIDETLEKKGIPRITLTAKEAAQYLGCSYWQLLEMVKRHEGPANIRIGKRVLFREETLIAWLNDQEQKSLQTEQQVFGIRGCI